MHELMDRDADPIEPADDDLPVSAMQYSLAEHYALGAESLPIMDARQFDTDLERLFIRASDAPLGESARDFLAHHRGEVVGRVTYWTGEAPSLVGSLVDHLTARARELDLRVGAVEAATLIELTAFVRNVVMQYRHARTAMADARPRDGSAA
jgi:hypothetical protein